MRLRLGFAKAKTPAANGAAAGTTRRHLRLSFAGCSLQGPRAANQDRMFWIADPSPGQALLAVADGMGGYDGGEQASRLAIEHVEALVEDLPGVDSVEALRKLVARPFSEAVKEIEIQAGFRPNWRDMGTTLSTVGVLDGKLVAATVGDTRVYHLSEGELFQISEDHTALAEALAAGSTVRGTPEAGELARMLTRLLGAGDPPEVDVRPEAEGGIDLHAGDVVLICSDGVHGAIADDAAIRKILQRSSNLQCAVNYLCDYALQKGGEDNATAVAVAVGAWKQSPGELPRVETLERAVNWVPIAIKALATLAIILVVAIVVVVRTQFGAPNGQVRVPPNLNGQWLPENAGRPPTPEGGVTVRSGIKRTWPCKGKVNGKRCGFPLTWRMPKCPKCGREPEWNPSRPVRPR